MASYKIVLSGTQCHFNDSLYNFLQSQTIDGVPIKLYRIIEIDKQEAQLLKEEKLTSVGTHTLNELDDTIRMNLEERWIESSKLENAHSFIHLSGLLNMDFQKEQDLREINMYTERENLVPKSNMLQSTIYSALGKICENLKEKNTLMYYINNNLKRPLPLSVLVRQMAALNFIFEVLSDLHEPPKNLLIESGVFIYGSRPKCTVSEESPRGSGMLSDMFSAIEDVAETFKRKASKHDTRLVLLRFGLILTQEEGIIKTLLPIYSSQRLGPIGYGTQYISWIDLDDAVRAIHHILQNSHISGPLNICAPSPVTNHEFTDCLNAQFFAKHWFSPPMPFLPNFAQALLGQSNAEILLSSINATPEKLLDTKFEFKYPSHRDAIKHSLDKE